MDNKIKINTNMRKGIIEQETIFPDSLRRDIIRQVVDLQEEGIRNALVLMGWTPPKEGIDSDRRYHTDWGRTAAPPLVLSRERDDRPMINREEFAKGLAEYVAAENKKIDKLAFDMVMRTPDVSADSEPHADWSNDMGVRENKVEKYLDEEVALLGGLTRKWTSPSHAGVPDRIVFIQGDVWFVEVKTNEGRLSPEQVREHRRLKDTGAQVTTVYGRSGVDKFLEYFKC